MSVKRKNSNAKMFLPTSFYFFTDLLNVGSRKTMRIAIVFIFFIVAMTVRAENIKPFTTDGCSSFPDGTFGQKELWLSCCTAHDYAYWQGGTYEQRLVADKQLHLCVSKVGEPHIAKLMLAGVRVGGSPYFPTPYRWGYGWPYSRWYKPLTEAEKKQIKLIENDT